MEDNEFATSFSTDFFTDFSSEFTGYKPAEIKPMEDITLPEVVPEMKSEEQHIKTEKMDKLVDDYKEFVKELQKPLYESKQAKEERDIINKHRQKYKKYDEDNERSKKATSLTPLDIPESVIPPIKYPRVERALNLLHRGINNQTRMEAKEIGCSIKGDTLYPIEWTNEEIDELNRRLYGRSNW